MLKHSNQPRNQGKWLIWTPYKRLGTTGWGHIEWLPLTWGGEHTRLDREGACQDCTLLLRIECNLKPWLGYCWDFLFDGFSDCDWPWATEAKEKETADKRRPLYYGLVGKLEKLLGGRERECRSKSCSTQTLLPLRGGPAGSFQSLASSSALQHTLRPYQGVATP